MSAPSPNASKLIWLKVLAVSALVVPALVFAVVAAYLYRQEFQETSERLAHSARVAQEQALKLLETNEMLLQRMLDLWGNLSDAEMLARGAEMHERLKKMSSGLPQVQGLFISGADGRPLVNSLVNPPSRQIDYSDREWYRWHRQGERGAFMTEQLQSRVSGEAFFDISRRRNLPDGSFGGTVNASLRPEYLTNFYKELDAENLRFAIVRADGRLIARWPDGFKPGTVIAPDAPMMRSFAGGGAKGEYQGVSAIEPVKQIAAWRRLGSYPAYAVVSIDRAQVLAAWSGRIALLALFAFPLAAGFAGMTWYALLRTRDEIDAATRLEAETRRRRDIELALEKSQKLEAMGRLAGGIAHDFNNLMMVVINSLHLLQRTRPELAGNAQLAAIGRAMGSGAKITRQILSFSRQQALVPQRILLQEHLPGVLMLLHQVLGSSIEVSHTVAADTAAIEVDPAELELALINLAVNSRDAMPQGGRIQISARNAAAGEAAGLPGDFVLLEVADSGSGMEPAVAERAFEPFFTTKPVGHGTGLGLSQVQGLCESAGGKALIESRPGAGSRVRLYFPQRGRLADAPARESAGDIRPLSCRLLLVEDNESVALATSEVLQSLGCEVDHVGEAATALARLEAESFDAVLSDIEMPGSLDGIELAARLAKSHPHVPVVLMTGYASRLEQAVRERYTVVPKPCPPRALADAIHGAMNSRR